MGQSFLPCYYSLHGSEAPWVTALMGWCVRYVHTHRFLQVTPELTSEGRFRNSQGGQREELELQTHILGFCATHIRQTVILLKPNLQFAVQKV